MQKSLHKNVNWRQKLSPIFFDDNPKINVKKSLKYFHDEIDFSEWMDFLRTGF
jgi:hypothetical protein